jgi:hypothetical protein
VGRERARPAGHPVHLDPFPAAARDRGGTGPNEGHVERLTIDDGLDPGDVRAPADELGVGCRAVGVAPGEQDDRLEEAGLAGGIGAPDQLRSGTELGLERGVTAQIGEPERGEGCRRGPAYEVVRTGITTCT